MDFQLVPKSVTLNDPERRNGRTVCVISLNWGSYCKSSAPHSFCETQRVYTII